MGRGRPRKIGPTKNDLLRLYRAQSDQKKLPKGEIDFSNVNMSSKSIMWSDAMTKSVFTAQGDVERKRGAKPIVEPLRIITKRSTVSSTAGRKFR